MTHADEMHELIARLDAFLIGPKATPSSTIEAPSSNPQQAPEESVKILDFVPLFERCARLGGRFHSLGNSADALHNAVVIAAMEVLAANRGALFMKNTDGGLKLTWPTDDAGQPWLQDSRKLVDQAAQSHQLTDNDEIRKRSQEQPPPYRCALALVQARPVAPGEDRRKIVPPRDADLLGVLLLEREQSLNTVERLVFQVIAQHSVTALLRDQHLRFAITDPLTRCFTRPHLGRELARSFEKFEGVRTPFVLILANIDRFAAINEDHGHGGGDIVLSELAQGLKDNLRDGDLLFRYGGDTFAILLPDTDLKGSDIVAAKLRDTITTKSFHKGRVSLTLSLGLAACPYHATSVSALLSRADQALKQAKLEGRNGVRVWAPVISQGAPGNDALAGLLTGDFARDYRHVQTLLETLFDLSKNPEETLEDALSRAVDRIIATTDAERGAVILNAPQAQSPRIQLARNKYRENVPFDEHYAWNVVDKVFRTGEALGQTATTSSSVRLTESFTQLELKTVLCAPLRVESETIGVVFAEGRALTGDFQEAMLPFFTALARCMARQIEGPWRAL